MARYPPHLFRPSLVPITTWENDYRPLPFLLLNLAVRGCVATVYFGDVLAETLTEHNGEKAIYLVCNPYDDPLHFSHVLKVTKDNIQQIAQQTATQPQTTTQTNTPQPLADLSTLFD